MRDRNTNARRPRRPESATRTSADRRSLEKCRRRDRRATGPCCCCRRYCYAETSPRPCAGCRDRRRTTSPRTLEAASSTVGVPSPRAGWTSRVSPTACRLGVPAHNLKARAVRRVRASRVAIRGIVVRGKRSKRVRTSSSSKLRIAYIRALGDR